MSKENYVVIILGSSAGEATLPVKVTNQNTHARDLDNAHHCTSRLSCRLEVACR